MRRFTAPDHAIQTQAAIDIAAPPEQVAAVYRNVERWGETFAATIDRAWVIETGANWQLVEVAHKKEGRVPNTLIFLSDTVIGLEESKKSFDASFLNEFEPAANGGTRYVLTAYVSLKGIYKLLKPFLEGYVRRRSLRQMRAYVLNPLKTAVEKERS
ncbi:MAG: SRPBCC family protein [Chloroflexota bacterium]